MLKWIVRAHALESERIRYLNEGGYNLVGVIFYATIYVPDVSSFIFLL